MGKLIFSIGIILLGLLIGYGFQQLYRRGAIRLSFGLDALRRFMQRAAFLVFEPLISLGAVWSLDLKDLKVLALPFIGLFALALGGAAAFGISRLLRMTRRQTGAYVVCGWITNIGSIGALVTFTFLGEQGLALVAFYRLFEMFSYYTVGFSFARAHSDQAGRPAGWREGLKRLLTDPFVLVATGGLLAGLALNLAGVPRPAFYGPLNAVLVPFNTLLFLSSVGMGLRLGPTGKYIKQALLIAAVKFALVPATVTTAAWLLGFGSIQGGLPLRVVLILSSMPVGFTALVPPTLYDLDLDLANACWLVTTCGLVVIVPLLYLLVGRT